MFGERGRWIVLALGASILINLFLAGVLVGRLTTPGSTMPGWAGPPPANGGLIIGLFPRAQIGDLPASEKKAFWTVMRSHAAEMRAAHARVVELRRDVVAAIGAPVFNRETLNAKLDDLRRATLDQQMVGEKAAVDALAVLSAQSRAAIARDATDRMNAQASINPAPRQMAAASETPSPAEPRPAASPAEPAPITTPSVPKPADETQPAEMASPEVRAAMKNVRQACATDIATLCKDVEPGGGRIAKCLKEHRDDLSAGCKSAWQNMRAVRQGEKN